MTSIGKSLSDIWFTGGLTLPFRGGHAEAEQIFSGGRIKLGVLPLCFWLELCEPTLPMSHPSSGSEYHTVPRCFPVPITLMHLGLARCWRFIYKPRFSHKGKMAASPALP